MYVAPFVYLLCLATSIVCLVLLIRTYARTGVRLLLWTAFCFVGLAATNLLLFVDLVMLPDIDLLWARHVASFIAVVVLIHGFVWESD
jgi:hypothetical protein